MTYEQAVSKRLKELLQEKGITQAELARRSRLCKSTISKILSGRGQRIMIGTLFSVCRALDATLFLFHDSPLFDNVEKR